MSSKHTWQCSPGSRDAQTDTLGIGSSSKDRATATRICIACCQIQTEVRVIQRSLDSISKQLSNQHSSAARDAEERMRQVYDDVIMDINTVRSNINNLGNAIAAESKYKTWMPLTPFRKEVLDQPAQASVLRASRSVDLVDERKTSNRTPTGKKYVPIAVRLRQGYRPGQATDQGVKGQGDDDVTQGVNGSVLSGGRPDTPRTKESIRPRTWQHSMTELAESSQDSTDAIDDNDLSRVRSEIIDCHNKVRRLHNASVLTPSSKLTTDAQMWAESLAIKGYTQYSNMSDRDESILLMERKTGLTGKDVLDVWYKEQALHNYSNPRWQKATRNFTQMVWRSTTTLGVGVAKLPRRDIFIVVIQYQPPGNTNTGMEYRYNVLPAILDKTHEQRVDIDPASTTRAAVTNANDRTFSDLGAREKHAASSILKMSSMVNKISLQHSESAVQATRQLETRASPIVFSQVQKTPRQLESVGQDHSKSDNTPTSSYNGRSEMRGQIIAKSPSVNCVTSDVSNNCAKENGHAKSILHAKDDSTTESIIKETMSSKPIRRIYAANNATRTPIGKSEYEKIMAQRRSCKSAPVTAIREGNCTSPSLTKALARLKVKPYGAGIDNPEETFASGSHNKVLDVTDSVPNIPETIPYYSYQKRTSERPVGSAKSTKNAGTVPIESIFLDDTYDISKHDMNFLNSVNAVRDYQIEQQSYQSLPTAYPKPSDISLKETGTSPIQTRSPGETSVLTERWVTLPKFSRDISTDPIKFDKILSTPTKGSMAFVKLSTDAESRPAKLPSQNQETFCKAAKETGTDPIERRSHGVVLTQTERPLGFTYLSKEVESSPIGTQYHKELLSSECPVALNKSSTEVGTDPIAAYVHDQVITPTRRSATLTRVSKDVGTSPIKLRSGRNVSSTTNPQTLTSKSSSSKETGTDRIEMQSNGQVYTPAERPRNLFKETEDIAARPMESRGRNSVIKGKLIVYAGQNNTSSSITTPNREYILSSGKITSTISGHDNRVGIDDLELQQQNIVMKKDVVRSRSTSSSMRQRIPPLYESVKSKAVSRSKSVCDSERATSRQNHMYPTNEGSKSILPVEEKPEMKNMETQTSRDICFPEDCVLKPTIVSASNADRSGAPIKNRRQMIDTGTGTEAKSVGPTTRNETGAPISRNEIGKSINIKAACNLDRPVSIEGSKDQGAVGRLKRFGGNHSFTVKAKPNTESNQGSMDDIDFIDQRDAIEYMQAKVINTIENKSKSKPIIPHDEKLYRKATMPKSKTADGQLKDQSVFTSDTNSAKVNQINGAIGRNHTVNAKNRLLSDDIDERVTTWKIGKSTQNGGITGLNAHSGELVDGPTAHDISGSEILIAEELGIVDKAQRSRRPPNRVRKKTFSLFQKKDESVKDAKKIKDTRKTNSKLEQVNICHGTLNVNNESYKMQTFVDKNSEEVKQPLCKSTSEDSFASTEMHYVNDNSLDELLDLLGDSYQSQKSNKNVTFIKTVLVAPVYRHKKVMETLSSEEQDPEA